MSDLAKPTFPAVERVIYPNNPLIQVTCQIAFPNVLRIEVEPPAAFHEAVRADYPTASERPPAVALGGAHGALTRAPRTYDFFSKDEQWQVTLCATSLTMCAFTYEEWSDFLPRFMRLVGPFCGTYSPAQVTRIGLQYQNAIEREVLHLKGLKWDELVRPELLGALVIAPFRDCTSQADSTYVLKLSESERMRASFGFATNSQTKNIGFLIDADFYRTEPLETDHETITSALRSLHGYAGPFFRWCIQDRLHHALRADPGDGDARLQPAPAGD